MSLLYCPDRELYPPNPEREEPKTTMCETCCEEVLESHAIRDRGGMVLCNHKKCIEAALEHDLKYCYPSDIEKVNEYYNNLLNQTK